MPTHSEPLDSSAFDERLASLALRIDEWARAYVESNADLLSPFYDMMSYHMGWATSDGSPLSPPAPAGKRIRPVLAVLVCEALGASAEAARGSAVAVELVHNFSLVHDDIQDVSDHRRGRPTVWKIWGAPQAINVGDALFALAQVALAHQMANHPRVAEALIRLNRTCVRLVEGQFLDIRLESVARVSLDLYEQMIARKTGALIECAAALGAIAADAEDSVVEKCARFGLELGVAYQLQDDLLGTWGDPASTGKPIGDDIRSRKKSFPLVLGLGLADQGRRDRLNRILDVDRTLEDGEVADVLAILDDLGVREQAQGAVDDRFVRGERALAAALPAGRQGDLLTLCSLLRVRMS